MQLCSEHDKNDDNDVDFVFFIILCITHKSLVFYFAPIIHAFFFFVFFKSRDFDINNSNNNLKIFIVIILFAEKRSALRAAQSKEKQESIINANLKPDSNVGKNTQSHEEDRTTNNIINKHECVKSEQNIDISSKENNEDILKFGKCQFFENEDDEDDDEDKENSDESKENKVWKLINELSKLETTYNNSIETTDNPIETSSCKDNNDVVQEFISKSGDDLLTKSIVVTSDGEEEDVSDENDGELRSTVHFRHSNAEPYKYSKFSTSLQSPADLYFSYKNCIKKPLKKKVVSFCC